MKIYISCVQADIIYANQIIENVKAYNSEWEFVAYYTEEKLGDSYHRVLSKNIRDSDAVVFIISDSFNKSTYGALELDWTLAYYYEHQSPIILPLILDSANIPQDIQQFLYLQVDTHDSIDRDLLTISNKLVEKLSRLEAQKKETKLVEFTKRLTKNGSEYIQETKDRLKKEVKMNKIIAYFCYSICFVLLCLCAILCFVKIYSNSNFDNDVLLLVQMGISSIALLSLLIATARFAFVLGKSFMVEAIRNMDRIHAIDFGDFYLKLFEERFEWPELKEILQNWNIDKGSAFISQNAADIDPAVLSAIIELAAIIRK